jgi:hypothetical protein
MDENGLATDLRSAGRRFEYADACTSRAETMTGFAGDVRAREPWLGMFGSGRKARGAKAVKLE